MNRKLFVIIFVSTLILSHTTIASNAKAVYENNVSVYATSLINSWNYLPFKDIRPLDKEYINWVTTQHGYGVYSWNPDPLLPPDKCLSYSASTLNDWFSVQEGKPLIEYHNFVNNLTENGTNPRFLEAVYLSKSGLKRYYDFAPILDPITYEKMPYDIKGYADILTGNYPLWINEDDTILESDYKINLLPYMFNDLNTLNSKIIGINIIKSIDSPKYEEIKNLIDKYGIVYAQLYTWIVPVHAVTLIGYGKYDCDGNGTSENIFWIHDTYSTEWDGNPDNQNVRYKCVNANDVSEVLALYDPTWSTYQHDLRRTGLTTLKGSINNDYKRQYSFTVDSYPSPSNGVYVRDKPSIGDVDSDGKMEIITTSSLVGYEVESKVYATECKNNCAEKTAVFKTKKGYPYESEYYIMSNPTIENINSGKNKEILLASTNKIIILNGDNGKELYTYKIPTKRISPTSDYLEGEVNYLAVADIDLDGDKEILFADNFPDKAWQSRLYVLNNKLKKEEDILIGSTSYSSGPIGAIAIANLIQSSDSCNGYDYPEIVVGNVLKLFNKIKGEVL